MYSKVSLADLIDAGLLKPNTVIVWRRQAPHQGMVHKAKLTAMGRIQMGSGTYRTPTAAARELNNGRPVNGWVVWHVGDVKGPTLASVRKQLADQAK